MRENVLAFAGCAARCLDVRGPVYAFGSRRGDDAGGDDDGEQLRHTFAGRSLTYGEMRLGATLGRGERLAVSRLADQSAAAVLCLDALEHVFDVRQAMDELLRVLRPGGLLIATTYVGAPLDLHPGDYWRITPSCLAQLLAPLDATVLGCQGISSAPHTLLAVGCKSPVPPTFAAGVGPLIESFETWLGEHARTTSWLRRVRGGAAAMLQGRQSWQRWRDRQRVQFAVHVPLVENWKSQPLANPFASKSTGSRIDLG